MNAHWQGYSRLQIGDGGKPCVQVAGWLEWGVAPGALFAPDNGSGSSLHCVMPAEQQKESGDASDEAEDDSEDPVRLRYDVRRQRLSVRIDASLMSPSRGYVPPSRLDDGIPAVWLDYQVKAAQNNGAMFAGVERRTTLFGTFNLGANAGPWRIRSSHIYSRYTDGKPEWEHIDAYAQRDIARWRGRLRVGEGYTDNLLFDSMPYTAMPLVVHGKVWKYAFDVGAFHFTPYRRKKAQTLGSGLIHLRRRVEETCGDCRTATTNESHYTNGAFAAQEDLYCEI
ncbi:hypothetical protein FAZ69_06530 [Trinickia terrae]|uniref:PapC N-terminal domain-containing protein n=1 Tax=Trinickia terrae TaxID=2571161 RepID=A0A4U1IBT1_9BURK|nr:fimbria/pilus outer membrane usher protein [Trinickia terrae]TKC91019.1 hypothetical protein FAZ69_06530 [Trinickia terrae]